MRHLKRLTKSRKQPLSYTKQRQSTTYLDRRVVQLREDGMHRVDRALRLFAIEKKQVLDRLFALAEDVYDVLRQLAAQERRHGCELATEVLQEAAEKVAPQRLVGQL